MNFFLIGAPKAGTTLVHQRLSAHPDVFLSPIKEPNHYCTDIDPSTFSAAFRANTDLDADRYFAQRPLADRQIGFVRDPRQYAALFEEASGHRVIGECSTSYLWSSEAAGRVAAEHPAARILVVLRNPVDRLHSHWLMARKYGFTQLPLLAAVEKDMAHPDPGWGRSELFVEAGLYADGLKRWLDLFPSDRVRVLLTGQLSKEETWTDLARWLDLDGLVPAAQEEQVNAAGLARWERMNRGLTRSGLKRWAADRLPHGWKQAIARRWYSSEALPELAASDRRVLFRHFEEDIAQVERMLGIDLGHWRP